MAEISLTCLQFLGAEDLPRLSAALRGVPGVESVGLDAASGRIRVGGRGHLPLLGLLEAAWRAGYDLEPAPESWLFPYLDRRERLGRARFRWALVLTLPLLVLDFLVAPGPLPLILGALLHMALFALAGRLIFSRAWAGLRGRRLAREQLEATALLLTALAPPLAQAQGMPLWSSTPGLLLIILTLARWGECRLLNLLPQPGPAREDEPGRPESLLAALTHQPPQQDLLGRAGLWALRLLPALVLIWVLLTVGMLPSPGTAFLLRGAAALLLALNLRALALALPSGLLVAQMTAAARGLRFRRSRDIRDLRRARSLVFDRIGFLTRGSARVEGFQLLGTESQERLLALAAGALAEAGHPYLKALARFASERTGNPPQALSMIRRPGGGIKAEVAGRRVLVGHPWFLAGEGVDLAPARPFLEETAQSPYSPLLMAVDGALAGAFQMGDDLRPEMPGLLRRLHDQGLNLRLLTGDTEAVARRAAEAAGVESWRAGISTETRAAALREMGSDQGPVAAMGTGVHDAPLLAAAPFGIALGGDLRRLESTVLILESEEPAALLDAFRFSRATALVMLQNLVMVSVLAGLALLLAFTGVLGPVGVALLQSLALPLVWLNSLRLTAFAFENAGERGR